MNKIVNFFVFGTLSLTYMGCVSSIMGTNANNKEFNTQFRKYCQERNGIAGWDLSSDKISCTLDNKIILGNYYNFDELLKIPYGLDADGYNKFGFNREGFDKKGYNKFGFNKDGYDIDGLDQNGFNSIGIYKNTNTYYNYSGFDKNGFDKNGFAKSGYDKNWFDKNGFDISGFGKNGKNRQGLTKYEVIEKQKLELLQRQSKATEEQNNYDSLNQGINTLNNSINNINNNRNNFNASDYDLSKQKEKNYYYVHPMGPNLYYVK